MEMFKTFYDPTLEKQIWTARVEKNISLAVLESNAKTSLKEVYNIMSRDEPDIKKLTPMSFWEADLMKRIEKRKEQVREFDMEMNEVFKKLQQNTTKKVAEKLKKERANWEI